MKHYYRVKKIEEQPRRNIFFSSLISGMGVTGWLIIINIAVFLIAAIIKLSGIMGEDSFYGLFSLQALNLFDKGYIWTLFTSMFLHANFFHLFVNMFSLFFIGRFLETLIGKKRFFWLYIISGIFAGLFFSVLSYYFGSSIIGRSIFSDPHTFAVGASGAIFAIAGVLALLTPRNKVYLIAGPLIAIISQAVLYQFLENSAILSAIDIAIMLYIVIAIFSMFSFNPARRKIALPIEMPFWFIPIAAIVPLIIVGLFIDLPIGNMAHLGGFIAGAVYGIYLRVKYKKKTQMISEYFSR